MTNGFSGDAAAYYARYRRGYPDSFVDALVHAVMLSSANTIIDLGCGTGQLALPLAIRVGRVIGVDPEPDMLCHARAAALDSDASNVEWILGPAQDLVSIAAKYSDIDAVTVANAIHLVDCVQLFQAALAVLRPGRGLAVIANSTPLWLQDTAWSHALRTFLERWLGTRLTSYCGTDDETRSQYRDELIALGYGVEEIRMGYTDVLSLDQIVGGVFSAMSDRLPAAPDRTRFASELKNALADTDPYTENVEVRSLIGRVR
ncbi:MAG: class I SAM-dependent methyltransferase [Pseudonocardiaceae bacterium]